MMNSHSKILDDFKGWLSKWNTNIVTQDDIETQSMVLDKLTNGFSQIEKLLHKTDQKVMRSARGNLIPGSNEANEKEVLAMLENQKKPFYKNLKQLSLDLTYIRNILENVYEIKNRRSYECFYLRAENSRLRAELEKLKNEKK